MCFSVHIPTEMVVYKVNYMYAVKHMYMGQVEQRSPVMLSSCPDTVHAVAFRYTTELPSL